MPRETRSRGRATRIARAQKQVSEVGSHKDHELEPEVGRAVSVSRHPLTVSTQTNVLKHTHTNTESKRSAAVKNRSATVRVTAVTGSCSNNKENVHTTNKNKNNNNNNSNTKATTPFSHAKASALATKHAEQAITLIRTLSEQVFAAASNSARGSRAIALCSKLIENLEKNPKAAIVAKAYHKVGYLLFNQNRYKDAVVALRRAIVLYDCFGDVSSSTECTASLLKSAIAFATKLLSEKKATTAHEYLEKVKSAVTKQLQQNCDAQVQLESSFVDVWKVMCAYCVHLYEQQCTHTVPSNDRGYPATDDEHTVCACWESMQEHQEKCLFVVDLENIIWDWQHTVETADKIGEHDWSKLLPNMLLLSDFARFFELHSIQLSIDQFAVWLSLWVPQFCPRQRAFLMARLASSHGAIGNSSEADMWHVYATQAHGIEQFDSNSPTFAEFIESQLQLDFGVEPSEVDVVDAICESIGSVCEALDAAHELDSFTMQLCLLQVEYVSGYTNNTADSESTRQACEALWYALKRAVDTVSSSVSTSKALLVMSQATCSYVLARAMFDADIIGRALYMGEFCFKTHQRLLASACASVPSHKRSVSDSSADSKLQLDVMVRDVVHQTSLEALPCSRWHFARCLAHSLELFGQILCQIGMTRHSDYYFTRGIALARRMCAPLLHSTFQSRLLHSWARSHNTAEIESRSYLMQSNANSVKTRVHRFVAMCSVSAAGLPPADRAEVDSAFVDLVAELCSTSAGSFDDIALVAACNDTELDHHADSLHDAVTQLSEAISTQTSLLRTLDLLTVAAAFVRHRVGDSVLPVPCDMHESLCTDALAVARSLELRPILCAELEGLYQRSVSSICTDDDQSRSRWLSSPIHRTSLSKQKKSRRRQCRSKLPTWLTSDIQHMSQSLNQSLLSGHAFVVRSLSEQLMQCIARNHQLAASMVLQSGFAPAYEAELSHSLAVAEYQQQMVQPFISDQDTITSLSDALRSMHIHSSDSMKEAMAIKRRILEPSQQADLLKCAIDFQHSQIDILPKTWSIVSLSLAHGQRDLIVNRLCSSEAPVIVRTALTHPPKPPVSSASSDIGDYKHTAVRRSTRSTRSTRSCRSSRRVVAAAVTTAATKKTTNVATADSVLQRFDQIMKDSKENTHASVHAKSKAQKKQWWEDRYALDQNLQHLLQDAEAQWFGAFRGLALGSICDSNLADLVQQTACTLTVSLSETANVQIDQQMVLAIVSALVVPSNDELRAAICFLLNWSVHLNPSVTEVEQLCSESDTRTALLGKCVELVADTMHSLLASSVSVSSTSSIPRNPVILILDRHLQRLPVESLPSLRYHQVSRMPSLKALVSHFIHCRSQFEISDEGVFQFGVESVYYSLNPSNDLPNTQACFQDMFESASHWTGCVAEPPRRDELCSALETNDAYVYCGHSAGEQYHGMDVVKKWKVKSLVFLMGCSSGLLHSRGEFDPTGMVHAYLLAGAPSVVASLWDVTDRDIDQFTQRMLVDCGLLESDALSDSNSSDHNQHCCSVAGTLPIARASCRLRFLIGCAPVVYGVPCSVSQ
jgi:Peptidase family C50